MTADPQRRDASRVEPAGRCVFVFAGDLAYARMLAVSIHSLLRMLDPARPVLVVILATDFTPDARRRVERAARRGRQDVELRWEDCGDRLKGLAGARHLSTAAWSRLLIPEVLPDEQRVVYLDCDLVVTRDVSALFHCDLGGLPVGAIRDFAIASLGHEWSGAASLVTANQAAAPYFNSGVLVIDVHRWRTEETAKAVTDLALRYGSLFANCDQDALNLLLAGRWTELPLEFNVQSSLLWLDELKPSPDYRVLLERRAALARDAKIVHFVGSVKPWHHWCPHPETGRWAATLHGCGFYTRQEALFHASLWRLKRMYYRSKRVAESFRGLTGPGRG